MKRRVILTLLSLAAIVLMCSCSNEPYSPTGPVDPPDHTTDTLIVTYYDTVYVMVNDSTVDTVCVPCDTCSFDNCITLGRNFHHVRWSSHNMMVVINSDNPHAYGHGIDICITMRLRDGEYEITLTAWRNKVKPNQVLHVYVNGQYTEWPLGQEQNSTLQL